MAATKLVLQSAIDTLTCGAFVVPDLFSKLKADAPQAPRFSFQLLGQRLVAAGVDVNQRDVAE